MDRSLIVCFVIAFSLALSVSVNGNDAEFGRIITFDNFDHFKVSIILLIKCAFYLKI